MSDVHQVGTVDEEAFAAAAPCETEALLGSIAWDAIVEGVDNVEGAWEAECVIEEWAPEGVEVLDGAIGAESGVKEVFVFVIWWHCNSFLANISS
jgi:hypothetical protein